MEIIRRCGIGLLIAALFFAILSAVTLPTSFAVEATGGSETVQTEFKVNFNANGGTTPVSSMTVTNGGVFGELPEAVRSGYVFMGWYTSLGQDGEQVSEGMPVDLSRDLNLYARWETDSEDAPSYKVTFAANGGKVSESSRTVRNGQLYGELPLPVRSGYVFLGWFTKSQTGTQVTASTRVNLTENTYLYAHWEAEPAKTPTYRVTLKPLGGTVEPTEIVVEKGGTYGTLPVPYREGYAFRGWYTSQQGGKQVTASTAVNLKGSQTLYAQWTQRMTQTEITLQIGSREMTVDGAAKLIDGEGTTPVIRQDRTLLPVRAVIEALGGRVDWNGARQQVSLTMDGRTLYLQVGSTRLWDAAGNEWTLDVAPVIEKGRTLLPIRAVAEYFGAKVDWNGEDRTVTIRL